MLMVVMLINIILFCCGAYLLIDRAVPQLNKGVKIITVVVVVFTLITYIYYISLFLKADIILLAVLFSLGNLALIGTHIAAYKNLVTGKTLSGVKNRDVIFSLFIVLLLTVYFFIETNKWQNGDAIAIWNMHARFLLDARTWTLLFKNNMPWAHGDYPLMLPLLIAFFWKSVGSISPFVPVFIAYFPLVLIPLLVYFALYRAENNWPAWLAMAIFVLNSKFMMIACMQGADSLLALFILLVFVLYNNLKRSSKNILYLIGFIAAASTWVKNEGILFFAVFTLVFVVCNYRNKGYNKNYIIGAVVPLLVILSFKCFLSSQNDIVGSENNTGVLVHKLADYSRYIFTAKFLAGTLFHSYLDIIVLLLAMLAINRAFFKSQLFITVLLVVAGYFMIYVITPYDLQWHLTTSADRVLQHFYPAMVYGMMISVRNWYAERKMLAG